MCIRDRNNLIRFNDLCLSGDLWTYLADLNEQAQSRLELIIEQMKAAEGVTENMKATDQMAWVGAMNSIRNRAEEIVTNELIYNLSLILIYNQDGCFSSISIGAGRAEGALQGTVNAAVLCVCSSLSLPMLLGSGWSPEFYAGVKSVDFFDCCAGHPKNLSRAK